MSLQHSWIHLGLLMLLILSACGQDPAAGDFAAPRLGAVTVEAEAFRARIACSVSGSTSGVASYGIRFGKAGNALKEAAATLADGRISADIKALSADTDYCAEAWMTNGAKELSSDIVNFHTKKGEAVVEIPDPVFRRYLLENFDLNGDEVLTEPEALQITKIVVCTDSIHSLKGIEKMPNLHHLTADGTQWGHGVLREIDLSGNPLLEHCQLESNLLHTVDLSGNPNIKLFSASVNPLDSIDFSHNPKLAEIGLNVTDLREIPDMTFLNISSLHMAEVARYMPGDYLRHFPDLFSFNIACFQGKTLDLSQNHYLHSIWCEKAPYIEEIDLTATNYTSLGTLMFQNDPNLRRVLLRVGTTIETLRKDDHTEIVYVER